MPLSTMNKPWALVQLVFCLGFLFTGLNFLVLIELGLFQMKQEVYGDAVYQVSSHAWALGHILPATLSLYGVLRNGTSRWSPLFRVTGYVIYLAIMLAFWFWSIQAAFGGVVSIYVQGFFAPVIVLFIAVNAGDVRRSLSHA